jgi:hypothetical protein
MGVLAGGLYLVAVLLVILITPLVLGAYVVTGDQSERLISRYFAFVAAGFAVVLVVGVLATIALSGT